jgi:hypothetical protein
MQGVEIGVAALMRSGVQGGVGVDAETKGGNQVLKHAPRDPRSNGPTLNQLAATSQDS